MYFQENHGKPGSLFHPHDENRRGDTLSQYNCYIFKAHWSIGNGCYYVNAGRLWESKLVTGQDMYVCPKLGSWSGGWFGTTRYYPYRRPRASPVRARLKVLKESKRAGLVTSVMFGPLLPGISDTPAALARLFAMAAGAPRYLISAHEFEWDPEADPVWDRLNRIYGYYQAADRLAYIRGWGQVTLRPPAASHCNNVGPPHRKQLYPALQRRLEMPIPESDYQHRLEPEELNCFTDEVEARLRPRMLHELPADQAAEKLSAVRAELSRLPPERRRRKLQQAWAGIPGTVQPTQEPVEKQRKVEAHADLSAERIVLAVEPGIIVPMLLLRPAPAERAASAVVVGVAQHGKDRFLQERREDIAHLLSAGVAASARRGIVGYASVLSAPACYVPHDVIVPGVLGIGDVADLAGALAPRPLRLVEPVDGRNRALPAEALESHFEPARQAYADCPERLQILPGPEGTPAEWLVEVLKQRED